MMMIRYLFLLHAFLLLLTGCGSDRPDEVGNFRDDYSRIISLSPGITETIFALGAGERIVGVTRFCSYPPQTADIPNVGGYFDTNYEALLRLAPDLVIVMKEHGDVKSFLKKNQIPYLETDNHNVASLLQSFKSIGAVVDKEKEAAALVKAFEQKLSSYHISTTYKPKTLLVVDRTDMGSGTISGVWAAGRGTFFDDFLRSAGAENVVKAKGKEYQTLSIEGIISLAPQVIIDITRGVKEVSESDVESDWHSISSLPAVQDSLVFYIDSSYTSVPGPRIIHFLEDIQTIIMRTERIIASRRKS